MGWADDLRQFASKIGTGYVAATDEVVGVAVKLPKQNHPKIAPEEPKMRSYQGAPKRQHAYETVIPDGVVNQDDHEREVLLVCRLIQSEVAAKVGKVVNVLTGTLGIPNPVYHWGIAVGDYLHHLQSTSMEDGVNYYKNERLARRAAGWDYYPVGKTTFNDAALVDMSTKVMNDMPEEYNAFKNNCQTFSLRFADRILTKARAKKYFTVRGTFERQQAVQVDISKLVRVHKIPINPDKAAERPKDEVEAQPVEEVVGEIPAQSETLDATETKGMVEEDAEISRAEMLRNVAEIMIQNTPTLTRDNMDEAFTASTS